MSWSRRCRSELLAAWIACASPCAEATQTWLLGLRVNGIEQQRDAMVLQTEDGHLALREDDWSALGLEPTSPLWHDGQLFHRLRDAGLEARLDDPSQSLDIDAPADAFGRNRHDTAALPALELTPAGTGAMLNYDIETQRQGRWHSSQAWLEAGAFAAGAGDLRYSALLRHGDGGLPRWTRVDTTWTRDFPRQRGRLRLGDAVSHAGAWGLPQRFGGLQWSTDFSLQPGFVPYPLPSLQGSAALPSTADLYVDNSLRWQGQIAPGAFDLDSLPVVSGAGQVRLVVRDLLGREQVIEQSYRVSSALLRPGLRAQSFEVGRMRLGYGQSDTRYGDAFVSATDRLGLRPNFTREWRAEWAADRRVIGAAGTWLTDGWGTLQGSTAISDSRLGRGGRVEVAAERSSSRLGGTLRAHWSSPRHLQLGQDPARATRRELAASLGLNLGRAGIGLNLLERRLGDGLRNSFIGLNVSTHFGRWGALGVFAQHDRVSRQTLLALSLTVLLGERQSLTASVQRDGDAGQRSRLGWQSPADERGGFGGRASVDMGRSTRGTAEGVWNTRLAQLSAGLSSSEGATEWRAGASGAVAWLGRGLHASRRIDGSFAVVDLDGHADVPVLLENREIARTDARGLAMVPGLRPYESQRISIDAAALPLDVELDAMDQRITPPARSGLHLRMPLRRSMTLRFRLVDGDGKPWPAGTRLFVDDQPLPLPLGYEGEAYTPAALAGSPLAARWGEGECHVQLPALPPDAESQHDFGALECRP